MADRGRKAYPVSSHLCDERWQRHCMDLHKQRLSDMKHRIDNTKPETFDIVLSKGKRAMLDKERQTEVDRENAILLQKMVRIKEQDTRAVFRPWTARSTFQWKAGHYYDPATNTKTLDHINLTSSVSPRSIHYFALTRPGTAPPDVTARLRDMQIQVDNTKLLRAITTMRTHYDNDELGRRHAEESILVNRISNFRGPEYARYQPPGRSSSASRNSPYLAPLPGRATSSNRPPRSPRVGWPASSPPISQQRYYEEAQNRDIPPPSSRGNSRPGTALGGTQEGLGETSPRYSASRHSSSRPSASSRHSSQDGEPAPPVRAASGSAAGSADGSAAGSRPGSAPVAGSTSGSRPTSAAHGASFSFGAQEEQERQASARSEGRRASATSSQRSAGGAAAAADPATSAEDYADDQYEQDEGQYDKDQEEERQDAEEKEEEEERQEEEEEEQQARSSGGGEDGGEGEEEADGGYGEDAFDADADANADGGASAAAEEEEPEADQDADRDGGEDGGDDEAAASAEEPAAEDGDGDAAEAEPEADEDEAKSQSEKKESDGGEAFDADPEAQLRSEMRAAEEAEMDEQFAAEMAADADDEYGVVALDATSVGAASSYNTAASPKVGGFAADWD